MKEWIKVILCLIGMCYLIHITISRFQYFVLDLLPYQTTIDIRCVIWGLISLSAMIILLSTMLIEMLIKKCKK